MAGAATAVESNTRAARERDLVELGILIVSLRIF
jgi:hypothetical protein